MVAMAVGAAIALVILAAVFGIRRARARREAHEQLLAARGFQPCPGEAEQIATLVRQVHGATGFDVRNPWKRKGEGSPVYWYERRTHTRHDQQPLAADEFLCTLPRDSKAPFALFLTPAPIGSGFGSKLIEGVLSISAPHGLHKLELPASLRSSGVLGAFGPRGASIRELLGDELLSVLVQGARHGIFALHGNGDHCTMELGGAQMRRLAGDVSWEATWSYVERATRLAPERAMQPANA